MPHGTTNNYAELTAIQQCLLHAHRVKDRDQVLPLHIHSDSQWAVRVILGDYKARHHVELIQEIRSLLNELVDVKLKWVRGHAGQAYNELVDRMANLATYEHTRADAGTLPREDFLESANEFLNRYESIKRTT